MIERWVYINGSNNNYLISDNGNVRSLISNKILKYGISRNYLFVSIRINNKYRNMKIHRLVAMHFVDNIYNKPHVNHDKSHC